MTFSTQQKMAKLILNNKKKQPLMLINLSIQPSFSFIPEQVWPTSKWYFLWLWPIDCFIQLGLKVDEATGECSLWPGHACWDIPLLVKGLCANTCEGTGQVKLVMIKNITLLCALPLLTLQIRVLKIACQSSCWQWLMMGFYVYIYIYIVPHTPTRP